MREAKRRRSQDELGACGVIGTASQRKAEFDLSACFSCAWRLQTHLSVTVSASFIKARSWRSTGRDMVVMFVLLLVMAALCSLAKNAIQFNELDIELDIEQACCSLFCHVWPHV